MYVPNCRRCPVTSKLTGFVLNVSKSYTICPLGQTQLDFWLKLVMCLAHEGTFVILSA
ncbi:hypothetical protein Hanom_Chr17g01533371 [Helianthus anomalus]